MTKGNEMQDLIKKAEAGDINAQYECGQNYAGGYNGFPQSTQKSFNWFTLAANSGHEKADYRLSAIRSFRGLVLTDEK